MQSIGFIGAIVTPFSPAPPTYIRVGHDDGGFSLTAAKKWAAKRRDRLVGTHNDEYPNHTNKAAEIILIHNLLLFSVFLLVRGRIFGYFSCGS
ncbi:MAG: hypothetical protein GX617_04765 [Lentisphaerae bacterium]|jgi:hypothetical protein|nr:hypothetical protein [Lentisphaerota bacterium]